jgi:hypothetical protein
MQTLFEKYFPKIQIIIYHRYADKSEPTGLAWMATGKRHKNLCICGRRKCTAFDAVGAYFQKKSSSDIGVNSSSVVIKTNTNKKSL